MEIKNVKKSNVEIGVLPINKINPAIHTAHKSRDNWLHPGDCIKNNMTFLSYHRTQKYLIF
jgi:hypothetical protein